MSLLFIQVRLRLSGVHTGWSGALRFGFTSLDPSELEATDIPKYACPDLVTRPGYWAKALPERLALKDNVLSFWADRHGRVFYSMNEGEPILFHCGLSIGCPLWAIIDIYGITQEVTLLGKHMKYFFVVSLAQQLTDIQKKTVRSFSQLEDTWIWDQLHQSAMYLYCDFANSGTSGINFLVSTHLQLI